MWVFIQGAGVVIGIITGFGTLLTWVMARRKLYRVPPRRHPKGAWERVAAISHLTKLSDDDPYVKTMASAAARAAVEAEAFAAVERMVKFPLIMAGFYAALGLLAFYPDFDLKTLAMSVFGIAVFLMTALVNGAKNEGDRISIRTLVNADDDLIVRDPVAALARHARTGYEGNGYADARVVVKVLRRRMGRIRDERDELKQWAATLDQREAAVEAREQAVSRNWHLSRG